MSDFKEVMGVLYFEHFDLAVLEALGADLLVPEQLDSFPQSQEGRPILVRQTKVPGVCGPADDDAIFVGFDQPESVFVNFMLPGINVRRTNSERDTSRVVGLISGKKYKVPDPEATVIKHSVNGEEFETYSHYRTRRHAEPENLYYDIEVRARYGPDADRLRMFIRKTLQHRMYLPVTDSEGVVSYFTLFREGVSNTTEVVDVLGRFKSYVLSIRIEGQIDDYDEVVVRSPITQPKIKKVVK